MQINRERRNLQYIVGGESKTQKRQTDYTLKIDTHT